MKKRILTEAAGSPVSAYMIKSIQQAGHVAVASDISEDCAAKAFADDFVIFPKKNDPILWQKIEQCLIDHKIDVVIPSFDEMLSGWAERKELFEAKGIKILVSPLDTIQIFQDKWKTAEFFENNDLPCAESSLEPIYPLVKPRFGRGSVGVFIEHNKQERIKKFTDEDISQTVLQGEEYTVDCLFGATSKPIYIVPRKRVGVVNGKSTGGEVVYSSIIEKEIKRLAKCTKFVGPINVQCFVNDEALHFVEVNPRIAGGMALGFAATTNWVPHFVDILEDKAINDLGSEVKWGLKMFRTYQEFYIQ
ncbi:ATP-grasp domain-containing protein [Vibrio coralliirubri]|uniref:ATP-grasp domain-containing protein n=1 Tax=Vibrio coralliirubri TaxID=1516159 RepID=UPI00067EF5BA|nr:ATP-grasp domain-containing protein [Vibrio coralliirubri]